MVQPEHAYSSALLFGQTFPNKVRFVKTYSCPVPRTSSGTTCRILAALFLKCPISHEIMVDPVVGEDGQTYERKELARWLHVHNTSPMTGERMGARMVPNHAVKSMIANLSSTSA